MQPAHAGGLYVRWHVGKNVSASALRTHGSGNSPDANADGSLLPQRVIEAQTSRNVLLGRGELWQRPTQAALDLYELAAQTRRAGDRVNRRDCIAVLVALGAGTGPLASLAQKSKKVFRIGFLGAATATGYANQTNALRSGLRELGYVEGKTIIIEYRWAEGKYDRLPALARELVQSNVDLIVSHGTPGTLAAKHATSTIPIVIANIGDPVATGIVASLARPGGNITGQTFMAFELQSKRLELLKETAPHLVRAAVLFNPENPISRMMVNAVENTARALNIEFEQFPVRGLDELARAFAVMAERRVGAVCIDDDGWLLANNKTIADMAAKHRVLSAGRVEGAHAGLLIGYGENLLEMFRNAAGFVDKILRGAKPAALPIQRPIRFDLVLNLATAKAIGLKVPQPILARADRVIE